MSIFVFYFLFSIFDFRFSIFDFRFLIFNFRFLIFNFRFRFSDKHLSYTDHLRSYTILFHNFLTIFINSGQTDGNKEKRLQGHIDTPLNEVGKIQAKAAGKALENIHFDKAYASDLKRTQETCAHILENNETSSKLTINQSVLIKERGIADLENILIVEYYALAKKEGLEPIGHICH